MKIKPTKEGLRQGAIYLFALAVACIPLAIMARIVREAKGLDLFGFLLWSAVTGIAAYDAARKAWGKP